MNPLIIFSIVFAVFAAAVGAAYTSGALDPVIGEIAKYMFKAKAEAEMKALQAQGLQEGQDFIRGKQMKVSTQLDRRISPPRTVKLLTCDP